MCFHRKFHCISGYKNWHFDPKHWSAAKILKKIMITVLNKVQPNNKHIFGTDQIEIMSCKILLWCKEQVLVKSEWNYPKHF